jgi:hypothetical protein
MSKATALLKVGSNVPAVASARVAPVAAPTTAIRNVELRVAKRASFLPT